MADNLVFGVKIDLQKGVEEALKDGDKALERIEKLFGKHPITIKLQMDNRVARGASAELTGFKKQLAELTQQWNSLTAAERGSAAGAAIREQFRALRTEAQGYTSTLQAAVKAEDKMRESHSKTAASANKLSSAYHNQSTYLSRLIQRMAAYAGVSYVGNFLTNVREVTAQFELQRISLGAIIQDQQRANQLFEEIKTFALKSPVKILDLTKYTKQLAAYKIGVDELFDTTKRLTDISVGLSVPLERIILLYGQVRATGYLRGCLGKGTSVKMFDGSNKKVEDVIVGDAIMGDDGQKRNVLSLVRNRETMYIVKYDGGSFRCNENHILTLYNINSDSVEDVYVLDYLKCSALYKGVKCTNGEYEYFDMSVERDCEDDYFGFEIDGNKRFIIEGNIVTHNSEVRQATEAGIPLVEELAKKLEKANGELVRASDVMDMISKREIPFEMVKEVFEDMTNAGGLFYNMQEKQGNTLFGMWQKLGDAAAVMYDQIGNTDSVNEGMKMAIQSLRYLMLHWKQVGIVIGGVTTYIVANIIATKNATIATAAATTANRLHVASLQQKLGALRLEQMNLKSTHIFQRLYTAATISATKAQIGAATSTNVFSKALYGLKAALLSNPLTALAVALTTIIALLMQSESELDKLNSKLQDIDRDYDASGKKSVDRFKELVRAVEENVDGSKAQKEALDELDRTYGKILGSEALELDSLKALGGQYGELIDMIEAYNAKKKGGERETAIKSSYATILVEEKDDLMDYLNQAGMSAEKQAEFISRLNEKMIEHAGEADAAIKATNETFQEFANDISQLDAAGNILNVLNFDKLADAWGVGFRKIGGLLGGQGMDYLYNYAHALEGQNKALDENEVATRNAVRGLDEYAGRMDNLTKAINTGKDAILDWSSQEALYNSLQKFNTQHPENAISIPIDLTFDPAKAETEYDKMLESSNMRIHAIFANLQSIASQEGITIPEEFYKQAKSVVEGNKDFSFIDFDGLAKLFTTDKAKNAVKESRLLYESIAPSDDTVRMFNRKFMTLADNMDVSLDKMQKYLMKSGDNLGEHRKKLSDEVTNLLKEIARLEWTKKALTLFGLPADAVEEKIQESQQTLKLLQSMISTIPDIDGIGKKKKGGTKSDPRLQNLKEEISLTKKLYDEYHKLEKQVGATKAAEKIQEIYSNTIKTLQDRAGKYGFKFELPFTDENLKSNMQHFIDKMKELQKLRDKKGKPLFPNIGKEIDEAVAQLEDVDLNSLQKALEKKLKELSDRISRTKTAKEFYEKILGQTGNRDMAARLATSIFGENGEKLNKEIAERLRKMVEGTSTTLPDFVLNADMSVNSKALRGWVEANKTALGDVAKELTKFADESEKDTAKMIEDWLKATEKAKTYGDKLADVYRTTATEIARIEAEMAKGNLGRDIGTELIAGYRRKEAEEVAKLQYEAFKDSPMYVQMFDDLDHASTRMLENMKSRLESLQGAWRNLDPTQLKEMQSRLREIDEQLAKRNPFKVMADGLREYTRLRTKGDARGNTSRANADRDATEWAEKYLEAQEELAKITSDPTATEAQIAGARQMVDYTKRQKDEAEKTAANWKKVEDAIGLSANQLMQMLNWGGDIAHAIADISEAMGADEEDVQYWNDIASGLDDVSGAIQDIVSAAMSANVVGVISSALTAIPKMFVGFANIFSAGKIKRANKEIKRQQELIEALEYSYSRLEKAAEKTFGADYLRNVNERLRMLKAEAEAYRKQAEAERSKGKKRDKEAEKEYLEHARDTADEIEELNRELQEKITGTTVEKAAEDFANAWLDAYLSFGNTAEAIKEKFRDMMKTMVVNMALSGVVERMLKPLMDMIDERAADGELSSREIAEIMGAVPGYVDDIDNAMTVAMEALKAAGVDVGQLRDAADAETRGIAKGVASATSEEVNAATAVGKTLLYYASPIPRIDENLARVVALIESRGVSAIPQTTSAGWTDWQQQAMDNYQAIARNTAETVVRCERAAIACEKMARVIKTKGSTSGFNVFLNS